MDREANMLDTNMHWRTQKQKKIRKQKHQVHVNSHKPSQAVTPTKPHTVSAWHLEQLVKLFLFKLNLVFSV